MFVCVGGALCKECLGLLLRRLLLDILHYTVFGLGLTDYGEHL